MSIIRALVVGGIEIPMLSSDTLSQSYRWLGGTSRRRMLGGRMVSRSHWRRLATEIAGEGGLPVALAGLAPDVAVEIQCVAELAVSAVGNVQTLPTDVRAGALYAPKGVAVLADGTEVITAVAMAGRVATCTIVAGAAAYRVRYTPVITAFCDITTDHDAGDARHGWRLSAEEG